MDSSNSPRAVFLLQELILGGAAYFAIRLMHRLSPDYAIDVLITGPCSPDMLRRIPGDARVFRKDHPGDGQHCGDGDHSVLAGVKWAAEARSLPPLRESFDVLLSTSILQDWRSCIAHTLINADRKLLFLVDEALKGYPVLPPARRVAIARAIETSSSIVAVSASLQRAMSDDCIALRDKPFSILPPLLDETFLRAAPQAGVAPRRDGPLRVLSVARLTAGKRIADCVRAHARLIGDGVDIVWDVIGDGDEYASIKSEIARRGVRASFTLHPPRTDIPDWMRRADLLVLFSDSEGCPTVVLEALHMGCPVVTTAAHGIERFVRHRENGLIVAPDVAALASAVRELATDTSLLARMRQAIAQEPVRDLIEDAFTQFTCLLKADPPPPAAAAPRVSILIPTYNQAHCVSKAISSALMQDFPSLEVIVVDDHSGDDTEEACRPWLSDPRLRYVRNSHNRGRVANYRNALHELARGDWVIMLDGDDYLTDAGFVSAAWQLVAAHAGQGVVFVQAGHTCHHLDGSRPDAPILPDIDGPQRLMDGGEYLKLVYGTGFFTHLGLFYDRRIAIGYDAYRADISSSDMESFLRIALAGRVIVLNTSVGRWVQSDSNASSNLPPARVAENVRIFRDIAGQAISAGLLRRGEISSALRRYQAHTLAFLYRRAFERECVRPATLTGLVREIVSIHPSLLLNQRVRRLLVDLALRALRPGST